MLEILDTKDREIVELISEGRINKEIADIVGLTPSAVKARISRLIDRFHANNRAHLVKMYIEKN